MNEKGQQIITLRKQGKTYGEIEEILKLPKSTVGWWLRGIKMEKSVEKQTIERCRNKWRKNISDYNKIYAKIRSKEAADVRENNKKKGALEIKKITLNGLKLIGSALYWAEGNTKNRHLLRFANSKPEIIKTMMDFFRRVCNIPEEKIKARIHLYPSINEQEAINYWKKITNLPKKNFHPSQIQISRASKGKRSKNTLPYGTLHLTAGNTEITCRVKGWIRGISEKINAGVV
ncbi:hypothetical protein L6252_01250 [Candidatus Parcubacteria bacterium]|nr:hypothetical protein [Candidatus Parcubacteria bacterium]